MPALLLDRFMPECDVASRHELFVAADRERVYESIMHADFRNSWIIRTLLAIRSLPARLTSAHKHTAGLPLSVGAMAGSGFVILGESPPDELVIGIAGRPWKPAGELRHLDTDGWLAYDEPNTARAVWQFSCEPREGGTLLSTQTRVRCNSDKARASFLPYWRIVGPFSGIIRNQILSIIKHTAESTTHPSTSSG
ncbi:MAG: hypothetical protein NVSMB31_10340 [Vulcanimicrobiaceae bacterium]